MMRLSLLDECAKEPIHIPGSIQPHGVLLVTSRKGVIRQVSANCAWLFDQQAEQLVGQRLHDLPGLDTPALRELLANAQAAPSSWTRLSLTAGRELDAFAYVVEDRMVLELEPVASACIESVLAFQRSVQLAVTRLQDARDLSELSRRTTEEIARLSGFDRVMLYRFDEEWNGSVIAEQLAEGVDSYLGQHFPASDIPPQARALFLENWLRMIPDAGYVPVPLHPQVDGAPIDLTRSCLRSASPIHLEYLRNMGVSATLTVSLVRGGRLWGLVACHHRTPKHASYEVRSACELVGRLASSLLASKEESEDLEYKQKLSEVHAKLVSYMAGADDLVSGLALHSPNLLDLAAADGAAAAIYLEGQWTLVGNVPAIEQISRLADWLSTKPPFEVFSTNALPVVYPPAEAFKHLASGVLAISIPKSAATTCRGSGRRSFRPSVGRAIRKSPCARSTGRSDCTRVLPSSSGSKSYTTSHARGSPANSRLRASCVRPSSSSTCSGNFVPSNARGRPQKPRFKRAITYWLWCHTI